VGRLHALRRPYLLAVDNELAVVEEGEGTQAGQVAAGARLGEALAPHLGAGLNAEQVPLLLRSAVVHQSGGDVAHAEDAGQGGGTQLRQDLVALHVVNDAQAAAAELGGPLRGDPARGVQPPLPVQARGE
jgi:hypothetical protein